MKVLITGGNGFIGRNVAEFFKKKKEYEIHSPLRNQLDCTDEKAVTDYLTMHKFDCVLHFALCGNDIEDMINKNLRIFYNFYKNSHLFGKMFYAGSGAEYGKQCDIINVHEEDLGQNIPIDSYGIMKYSIAQSIESSTNIYNVRLFGIFGKYESYPVKFISNVCCKAIKDIPLSIRKNVYFDYLWIDDFCRMMELMLNKKLKYHTYNIVSGQKVSLTEICENVLKISKKDLSVYICRDGLANEYTASNKRFLEEFPDFEYTPIEEAISELYTWYEKEVDIDVYSLLY